MIIINKIINNSNVETSFHCTDLNGIPVHIRPINPGDVIKQITQLNYAQNVTVDDDDNDNRVVITSPTLADLNARIAAGENNHYTLRIDQVNAAGIQFI